MKMADLVAANHNLILVLPRIGLHLGFGEHSVQEVCQQYGQPVDFVLMICNVTTFDDYLPTEEDLQRTNLEPLVPYLQASHAYYLKERLPHIGRHLNHLADQAGEPYAKVLRQFFADYQAEVREHFDCEDREVFPYLLQLQQGSLNAKPMSEHFADSHSDLVDKMSDLTQIVYKYLPDEGLAEELNELVFSVMQLSSDLEKHALIEEKILLPYVAQLERRLC